jgi:hypothetical protein
MDSRGESGRATGRRDNCVWMSRIVRVGRVRSSFSLNGRMRADWSAAAC